MWPIAVLAVLPLVGAFHMPHVPTAQMIPTVRLISSSIASSMAAQSQGRMQLIEPLPSPEDFFEAVSGCWDGEGCTTEGLAVVFFSSRQCATCRAFLPRLKRLAASLPQTKFYYIEHSEVTAEAFKYHEITEVPSFILFDGTGDINGSMSGLSPADWGDLQSLVEQHSHGCSKNTAWGM
eukprot:scaffold189568_cov28-Tisochrysis_lutea.AAC.1